MLFPTWVSGRTGPIHSLNIVQALEMCFESALGTVRSVFQNLRLGSMRLVVKKAHKIPEMTGSPPKKR
jgi:hypothetical protein